MGAGDHSDRHDSFFGDDESRPRGCFADGSEQDDRSTVVIGAMIGLTSGFETERQLVQYRESGSPCPGFRDEPGGGR